MATPMYTQALLVALLGSACATQRETWVVRTETRAEVTAHVVTPTPAPEARQTIVIPGVPGRLDDEALVRAVEGHGRWDDHPTYGRVWYPPVTGNFIPYVTNGAWVATNTGWYWQSGYTWGVVPFHYGRWVQLAASWAWVPGSNFSPAWVDWRSGGGWMGWAPLGPRGARRDAPYAYCAADRLTGDGLQTRTVTGDAGMSLYAVTRPARIQDMLGHADRLPRSAREGVPPSEPQDASGDAEEDPRGDEEAGLTTSFPRARLHDTVSLGFTQAEPARGAYSVVASARDTGATTPASVGSRATAPPVTPASDRGAVARAPFIPPPGDAPTWGAPRFGAYPGRFAVGGAPAGAFAPRMSSAGGQWVGQPHAAVTAPTPAPAASAAPAPMVIGSPMVTGARSIGAAPAAPNFVPSLPVGSLVR
jgi:hypothetical protein